MNEQSKRRSARLLVVAVLAVAGLIVTASPGQAASAVAGAGRLTAIPPTAFLQPEDLGSQNIWTPDADLRPALRPPQPCDADGFRSLGGLRTSGAIAALLPVAGRPTPTVLLEDIGLYRGVGGAKRYLRELRSALQGGTCSDPAGTWVVLDRGIAGDDSLLIRLDTLIDVEGSIFLKRTYVLVARVRKAVVVLADLGWEIGSGRESLVRALAPAAVRRAATLR